MTEGRGRRAWRWVRWGIYAAIVLIIWIYRPGGGRALPDWIPGRTGGTSQAPAASLVVTGGDLAPDLIPRLLEQYGRDHPSLSIESRSGGTNRALEALGAGRTGAAFLSRPPTPDEQARFREARGDTVLWFPVAVGGLVLLVAEISTMESLDTGELLDLVRGVPSPRAPRLFAADPNRGTWAALRAARRFCADRPRWWRRSGPNPRESAWSPRLPWPSFPPRARGPCR
jgi:ABC-type phosphate transport system substrate-binding protein